MFSGSAIVFKITRSSATIRQAVEKMFMRVLIVDDTDVGRLMLVIGVGDAVVCDEARDGAEAVALFTRALDANQQYGLVLMDVIMPVMDGKQALREMRKLEQARGLEETPIYLVSASENLDGVENLASGLMRKPPSRQALQQLVQGPAS
jgi:CheY-like chemotaxis protein